MLGTILIVILVLMLLGTLPTWSHSRSWGYGRERWAGIDRDHPASPTAHGTHLSIPCRKKWRETNMRTLMFLVVLLVIGIAGLGFYRGWFRLSTDSKDQQPSATVTVDKDKFHEDEQKAKDKVQGLGKRPRRKSATGPKRPKNRNADFETTLCVCGC